MPPASSMRRPRSRSRSEIVVLAALAALAACNGENPDVTPPPTNRPIPQQGTPASAVTLELRTTTGRPTAMTLDATAQLAVVARDVNGTEVGLASQPAFLSRQPDVISVQADGRVRAVAEGTARLVATMALPSGTILGDSMDVRSECSTERTLEMRQPDPVAVRIGGTVTLRVRTLTCGGRREFPETYSWYTFATHLLTVDASTGVVTGIQAGSAAMFARGNQSQQVLSTVVDVVP